jgi:hypothetical protein
VYDDHDVVILDDVGDRVADDFDVFGAAWEMGMKLEESSLIR